MWRLCPCIYTNLRLLTTHGCPMPLDLDVHTDAIICNIHIYIYIYIHKIWISFLYIYMYPCNVFNNRICVVIRVIKLGYYPLSAY
jgi:hypothetical protein